MPLKPNLGLDSSPQSWTEYQIPNYSVFENFTNTKYRIIRFLKMNKYQISNSTIRSQLFK